MTNSTAQFLMTLEISDFSATPKYLQLANTIIDAVKNERLKKNEMLPSINESSAYLEISRDTVEKAYRYLKKHEIIASNPGKGYYVNKTDIQSKCKIALFLNKLSVHKKIVYDSFAKELGDFADLDLFVYNSDLSYLKNLLSNLTKTYDYYVLFPHFREGRDKAPDIIRRIPSDKLMLLGRFVDDVPGDFPAVYENYEQDIYLALEKASEVLSKYKMIKLVFPDHSDFPKAIIKGFYKFCQQYAFDHELVSELNKEKVVIGTCYINVIEDDLVKLLNKIQQKNLVIGKDIGVISYNETPLKKFILNGITTISTDFETMGRMAANLIKNNSKDRLEVPFNIEIRASI